MRLPDSSVAARSISMHFTYANFTLDLQGNFLTIKKKKIQKNHLATSQEQENTIEIMKA